MVGKPDSGAAQAISYFPLTAPMAMPGRIAMGAAAWWEPWVAAALTLAVIAGLVQLAGRVYTRAILHSGPALSLRDLWRDRTASGGVATRTAAPNAKASPQQARMTAWRQTTANVASHRLLATALAGTGVVLGVAVGVFTSDVILGVAAGAAFMVASVDIIKWWIRHTGPPATPSGHG